MLSGQMIIGFLVLHLVRGWPYDNEGDKNGDFWTLLRAVCETLPF